MARISGTGAGRRRISSSYIRGLAKKPSCEEDVLDPVRWSSSYHVLPSSPKRLPLATDGGFGLRNNDGFGLSAEFGFVLVDGCLVLRIDGCLELKTDFGFVLAGGGGGGGDGGGGGPAGASFFFIPMPYDPYCRVLSRVSTPPMTLCVLAASGLTGPSVSPVNRDRSRMDPVPTKVPASAPVPILRSSNVT